MIIDINSNFRGSRVRGAKQGSQLRYFSFEECEEIYNNSQDTEDINYEDVTDVKKPTGKADKTDSIMCSVIFDMESFTNRPNGKEK